MRVSVLFFFFLATFATIAQRNFDVTIADSTYHMKHYWPACR